MVEIVIINRGIEDEGQLRGMSIRGIYPDEIVRVSAPRDDAAVVSDHEDGRSHGHSLPPPLSATASSARHHHRGIAS